jgi:hypothetical protein
LAVREWSADFNPAVEYVKSIAVWVRFSGLPIEYYDAKLLHVIGDRIGRSVKVDKTTLYQERGKYARLCVEVDLTKPLLAMFTIKGRHYKVEYEGLHFLCLNCGIFGHYVEGCPKRSVESGKNGENPGTNSARTGSHGQQPVVERPWTVVQKQRRPRKSKDHGNSNEGVNEETNSKGSRFAILGNEATNVEIDGHVKNLNESNMERTTTQKKLTGKTQGEKKKNYGGAQPSQEHHKRTTTRETRGYPKSNAVPTRGENEMDGICVDQNLETSKYKLGNGLPLTAPWVNTKKPIYSEYSSGPAILMPQSQIVTGDKQYFGPGGFKANHSRPPDWRNKNLVPSSLQQTMHGEQPEKDEFVDASENGISSNDESDMDLVAETQGLGHQSETENFMHTN